MSDLLDSSSTTVDTGSSGKAGATTYDSTRSSRWSGCLDMPTSLQELDNWCWAAISTNAANMYDLVDDKGRSWSQCRTAGKALACDCCSDWDPCDKQTRLSEGLEAVGIDVLRLTSGSMAREDLVSWLDQGRLICVRYAPSTSSSRGHFVAFYDHTASSPTWLAMYDPERGRVERSYDDLVEGYRGMVWTHTYVVRPTQRVS